ncbi:LysR family transcriptional regulator [Acanthopleuribacter pedis]|uniref:LysR family transcriptional regulator n=1 Tax=Acanthopleuribacter pedis TaxID=442870 RepID=A0A8J7Q4S6_9BACT|nr:LysR family transcriptional regulator [Acanthopleuribacter pedis]MBO1318087.1 LysR family transcriptional regulator [Acanthopleuribacter pedis]
MDISLADLKAFREVARLGKVSAAARVLNLSQPTVSWTMKKLERELGKPLLVRGNRGVTLTRAGKALLEHTGNLIQEFQNLSDEIQTDSEEVRGTYTLGVYAMLGTYTLPCFLPQLLMDYPALELRLTHDLSRNIAEAVINRNLDFGIVVNPPAHQDLVIRKLYNDFIGYWTHQQPNGLQDLTGPDSVLWLPPNLRQSETLLGEAKRRGFLKQTRFRYSTDLGVIHHMIAAGGGAGLLPATIALAFPGSPVEPIPNTPSYHDVICLVYRHDRPKTRAAEVVIRAISEADYQGIDRTAEGALNWMQAN